MFFQSQEEYNNAVDCHRMAVDSIRLQVNSFLLNMHPENLVSFRVLLGLIQGRQENAVAAYYDGIASGILVSKNLCELCGKDHDKELLTPETVKEQKEIYTPGTELYIALCKEYRLDIVNGVLNCSGCGIKYESLRDRMVKDRDDCSGCHQKAKFG